MKRLLIAFGLLILLIGGVLLWRATHPPLTDSEQIAANLNGIIAAADARSASGVGSYLSPEFQFYGTKKGDFQRQLVAGILQYSVIDVTTAAVSINTQGESATSRGSYRLSLKRNYDSPPEIYPGNFTLQWRKEDGVWKVVSVEGVRLPDAS